MARLPQILDALETVDYRERASINNLAVMGRALGVLPPSKTGSGAVSLSVETCARIIILLNVPVYGDRVAVSKAALEFCDLPCSEIQPQQAFGRKFKPPKGVMAAVAAAPTLAAAIAVLIERLPELKAEFAAWEQREWKHLTPQERQKLHAPDVRVELKAGTSFYRANITTEFCRSFDLQGFTAESACVFEKRLSVTRNAMMRRDAVERGVIFNLSTLEAVHMAIYRGQDP